MNPSDMRRSLGVTAAEPPRRLQRQSTEKDGGAGSANRPSRPRSHLPPRPSDASGGSKRQSGSHSRLPMPSSAASKAKVAKRSSSTGGPMQERNRNTLHTPMGRARPSSGTRSSERQSAKPRTDYQTPQRMGAAQQGRKSLVQSERRMTATGSKRLSGRGSAVGAKMVKDTRPLQDKEFQQAQTRRILDFLRNNEYSNNSLTSKNFPLQTREFVSVFNFIYNFIEPRKEDVLSYPGYHEQILALLKDLNYPGNIPRSHFVTLGSQHSWPAVLGCLSFLCDLANIYVVKLLPDITAIAFPRDFSTDNEKVEKLQFEHHLKCFEEFNNERDDFSELQEQLRDNLMDNAGVDMERLRWLDQEAARLDGNLRRYQGEGNRLENLEEQKTNQASDLAKMTDYMNRKESHHREKREDMERRQKEAQDTEAVLRGLQAQADELRNNCEQNKVSSYEAERNTALIQEKQKQLATATNDMDEVDKEIFQKEVQNSKLVDALDTLAKQTNSLALHEDIKNREGELVSLPKARFTKDKETTALPAGLKPELGDMVRSSRAEVRNREKELQGAVATVEQGREAIVVKRKEIEGCQGEVGRLQEETGEVKESARKTEEVFDRELEELREELQRLRGEDRADLEDRRREVAECQDRLDSVAAERREKREEGQQFLQNVVDLSVTHIEQATQHRDRATRAVLRQAQRKIEGVRATVVAVEEHAAAALAMSREARK